MKPKNVSYLNHAINLYFVLRSNYIFTRIASTSLGGPVYQDLHLITPRILYSYFVYYLLYSALQISMDQDKSLSQASFDLRHQKQQRRRMKCKSLLKRKCRPQEGGKSKLKLHDALHLSHTIFSGRNCYFLGKEATTCMICSSQSVSTTSLLRMWS